MAWWFLRIMSPTDNRSKCIAHGCCEPSSGNDAVSFSGRFGGVPLDVFLPLDSILGIYARENGQGMIFDDDDELGDPTPPEPDPIAPGSARRPLEAR